MNESKPTLGVVEQPGPTKTAWMASPAQAEAHRRAGVTGLLTSALPGVLACLAIAALVLVGYRNGWKLPRFSAVAGNAATEKDDWCEEHAVPESQCTRCNPDLVAAFKATGDWCEEHGLPESQCLKCNPDLKIVRPPKE